MEFNGTTFKWFVLIFIDSPNHMYMVPMEVQAEWNIDRRPVLGRRPLKPLEIKDPCDPNAHVDLTSSDGLRQSVFVDKSIKNGTYY